MSEHAPTMASGTAAEAFGQNAWIVEEMHQHYLANPASVDETWRAYFATPNGNGSGTYAPSPTNGASATNGAPPLAPPPAIALEPAPQPVATAAPPPAPAPGPAAPGPAVSGPAVSGPAVSVAAPAPAPPAAAPATSGADGEEPVALRGAAGRIVENMVQSLGVPTATSVHPLPAKLLEVNRRLINEYQDSIGGQKVSFTHLIAYALVKGLGQVPALNSSFVEDFDGKGTPGVIRHEHVTLGIAIDLERSGGSRSLVVPGVKAADTLDFVGFVAAYEDLVQRARQNKLTVEDFAGVTVTITNPGTLGTTQSVPRLMAGQGAIIGVGALDYPVEFAGTDPNVLASLGIGKVLTLTSTYDHRIIQGAESGLFLQRVHRLLLGEDGFYDEVFRTLGVPTPPARWQRHAAEQTRSPESAADALAVRSLVEAYRLHGHLEASIDPLAEHAPEPSSLLDPAAYGFSVWDLDRTYPTEGILPKARATLAELVAFLRRAYCSTVGVEYVHIQDPEQRRFIEQAVEAAPLPLEAAVQRYILERLNAGEAFERFLHTRYPALRRFSLEGGESTIPFIDAVLALGVDAGAEEAVIGMAHRGRLNVLANTLGKSFTEIFADFEDSLDPLTVQGSGDVKYHKGERGKWVGRDGRSLPVTMPPNPSHLETVNGVALGITRAKQDHVEDGVAYPVLSILIHGDASFAGQGVVAEALNLSQLPGYRVGGTVHLIINNQLGFTTNADSGRSTRYASDVAKSIEAPIFHVNGDDPEAVWRVAHLVEAYREAFRRDVVVDLVCYRKHGHNEGDEPSYTQPLMYRAIESHPSVREQYAKRLIGAGVLSEETVEADRSSYQQRMVVALEEARALPHPHFDELPERPAPDVPPLDVADGVSAATLERIAHRLVSWPKSFAINSKLERQLLQRAELFDAGEVDWALGEALAYGSLLLEGSDIRLVGQDSRRGTFSHRHSVLFDYENGQEYTPLASLTEAIDDDAALGDAASCGHFVVYDSLLSEYAALGFEYGYSVEARDALVLWEAQFGDFANGAQIVIDNYIVAAEEKWGQFAGLVMLLPHGYEGQGPEHSSARLERYLQLAANGNVTIVQPTTAAQFFHLLRAHTHQTLRRPLIVMSPKSILRARESRSSVAELVSGSFSTVLDDPEAGRSFERHAVRRVVLATGKLAFQLMERNRRILARQPDAAPVAIVRIEQLYPWPADELAAVLAAYTGATEVVYAQDEPENMGAWTFVQPRLAELLGGDLPLLRVSRRAAASPATGSHVLHDLEVRTLADQAVGREPAA